MGEGLGMPLWCGCGCFGGLKGGCGGGGFVVSRIDLVDVDVESVPRFRLMR